MRVLLHGGPIYAPSVPGAGAMLVVEEDIAWIGPAAGAAVHLDSADVVVDLRGAWVAPAFVDAHVHHTATGMTLLGLDLRGVVSRADLLARLSSEARRVRGAPIVGHGWDETLWADPRLPTRTELDRASWGSQVYLSRVDVHSALVSSALIAMVPRLLDAVGYEESGRVTAAAHHMVRGYLTDQRPVGLRAAAQRAARRHAAAAGVAAMHEAAGPDINGADDLRALMDLVGSESGPALVAYWGQGGGPKAAVDLGAQGAAGDLFVDGALGSSTAWLRTAYRDDPGSTGRQYLSVDEVTDHLVACTRAGVQAGFHAIGDAAIDIVVTGLRRAVRVCGLAAVRAARHRVEHLSMADGEHATVLAEAGVVASVQPMFDARWGMPGGAYASRLGDRRAAGLHDFAGLVRAGVSIALGSDSPVTPIEPWEWVRAAMWHHNPDARLSARAAFAAATRGGWRAARRDDAGALAPGAPATFALWAVDELAVQAPDARVAHWSTDPRSGTPGLPVLDADSRAPACLGTVLAGRTIHRDDRSPVGASLPITESGEQ